MSLEVFFAAAGLPVIIALVLIFNIIFSLITRNLLKKHLPENFSELKKKFPQPLKTIKITLNRFGNEKKYYGSSPQQSIPFKLLVYSDFFLFTSCGRALIINNFDKNFISFIKTESYAELLGKRIARKREDLIVFSPVSALQFYINPSDVLFLKNYIEEKQYV